MEIYKNSSAPVEARVEDLLSKMTLQEKVAQMFCNGYHDDINTYLEKGNFPDTNFGGIWGIHLSLEKVNKLQEMASKTRLGIPLIIACESLHGLLREYATCFPQSIGIGATFNDENVYKMADVIGKETYISGFRQTYAPDLDIAQDPRWGRTEETYGEDPYLTSRMGVAYVKGLQSHKIASTLKHYVAHGAPQGGLNLSPVHMGERELRESMLEPFAACIKEGGALSVMPAYSELDGEPLHSSRFLLTDILRDELGFKGFTISDYGATEMLTTFQKVAENSVEGAKMSLHAGLDMEAPHDVCYGKDFIKAAENGQIDMSELDTAVRRILTVKFRLGLFEDPYAKPERMDEVHTKESVALAREIATESIVMLKNDNILPLKKDVKVALVGPNADVAQIGDYSPRELLAGAVTVKAALESRIGAENVLYAKGCRTAAGNKEWIAEAVEKAKSADVVVAVMGDNSVYFGGIGWGDESVETTVTSGEGFDVNSLELPNAQKELFNAIAVLNKPVVFVLMSGRPYCIGDECSSSAAVLAAWYPGEQGGNALCDILFGDVSPSGKLPISFPRTTGHVPCYYNHKPSAGGFYKQPGSPEKSGRDYVFDTPAPLFEFGYGLSYTTFEYSALSAKKIGENEYAVTVNVKNTGTVNGKESVLLFVKQHYCPVTPVVKRLRKFKKIYLKAGQSATVEFNLTAPDFSYINKQMQSEVGKGKFTLMCGTCSAEITL